jgi:hypothetical protein
MFIFMGRQEVVHRRNLVTQIIQSSDHSKIVSDILSDETHCESHTSTFFYHQCNYINKVTFCESCFVCSFVALSSSPSSSSSSSSSSTASAVYWSEFLATDPEVPGSVPGATRFSQK